MSKVLKYSFEEISVCEMCGDDTSNHKVLGQRLNGTQGLRPKSKTGICVSVKKCSKCQLIYSSPMPMPENIQDHYGVPPEEYWDSSYFEWPDYFSNQIKVLQTLQPITPGAKALDVGAGLGMCINSLNKVGFDTYGLEPSKPFYEHAISKMNISTERLKLGMIEEVEYEGGFFDFITFGAVLEHLYHPAYCLEKALTWLKPGGIIQVEVPSSQYLVPKLINSFYRLVGVNYVNNLSPMHEPYHLYEFSQKSFEELSRRLNYKIVLSEFEVGNIHSFPKLLHPVLKKYMAWTQTGMQLTVWLKKN